jgi:hypothetical protein
MALRTHHSVHSVIPGRMSALLLAAEHDDLWKSLSPLRRRSLVRALVHDDDAWAFVVAAIPHDRWETLMHAHRRDLARGSLPNRWRMACMFDRASVSTIAQRITDLALAHPNQADCASMLISDAPDHLWRAISPDERRRLIAAAARRPETAALVVRRCPPERWSALDRTLQMTVLQAGVHDPPSAAAMMPRLPMLAPTIPDSIRAALIESAASDPQIAAECCAIAWDAWSMLHDDERETLIASAAQTPMTSVCAVRAIKADGRTLPPRLWRMLIRRIGRDPACAAAVLRSLTPIDELLLPPFVWRRFILASAQSSDGRMLLMTTLSERLWSAIPLRLRRRLIRSLTNDEAAHAITTMLADRWHALDAEERRAIIDAVLADPDSAATVVIRTSSERWHAIDDDDRRRIALRALSHAMHAERIAQTTPIGRWIGVWSSLDEAIRSLMRETIQRTLPPNVAWHALLAIVGGQDPEAPHPHRGHRAHAGSSPQRRRRRNPRMTRTRRHRRAFPPDDPPSA